MRKSPANKAPRLHNSAENDNFLMDILCFPVYVDNQYDSIHRNILPLGRIISLLVFFFSLGDTASLYDTFEDVFYDTYLIRILAVSSFALCENFNATCIARSLAFYIKRGKASHYLICAIVLLLVEIVAFAMVFWVRSVNTVSSVSYMSARASASGGVDMSIVSLRSYMPVFTSSVLFIMEFLRQLYNLTKDSVVEKVSEAFIYSTLKSEAVRMKEETSEKESLKESFVDTRKSQGLEEIAAHKELENAIAVDTLKKETLKTPHAVSTADTLAEKYGTEHSESADSVNNATVTPIWRPGKEYVK